MTAFPRKISRDANVLELVIQHAERASQLLMHVNIRGLRALLSRDGTRGFDRACDSTGALFGVVTLSLLLLGLLTSGVSLSGSLGGKHSQVPYQTA